MNLNAITRAAAATSKKAAAATSTDVDSDGAPPTEQAFTLVEKQEAVDDPDAEAQPFEEDAKPAATEGPTAEGNGAPPPPKKQRREDGLPVDVPEGSVAAAISKKIGRDLFAALDKDLARQGHTDNKTVHTKFLSSNSRRSSETRRSSQ